MDIIITILLAIIGISIIIWLLPFVIALISIAILVFLVYLFYVNYKANKIMKDFDKQQKEVFKDNGIYTYTIFEETKDDSTDEVIDVEFSESDDE